MKILKKYAKYFLKRIMFIRRLVRWWRLRTLYPCWDSIINNNRTLWNELLSAKKNNKILIATSLGSHMPSVIMECMLAVALTLRKSEVYVLLCDCSLEACQDCSIDITIRENELADGSTKKYLCRSCFKYAYKLYRSLGIKVHRYSEFLTSDNVESAGKLSESIEFSKIKDYKLDNIAVGEHAMAGALRFYARGNLEGQPYGDKVLRKYLKSALLTVYAIQNLLKTYRFESALFHHGIYVPQGLVGEVCRKNNLRVVNWNMAYKKSCFIFSHGDTYHHTLMNEPMEKWENIPWNNRMEKELLDYLKSRWYGTRDWIWFHEKPNGNLKEITAELKIDLSKPTIGMLTNVMWDAQLHYPANAFPNMMEWAVTTIDYFAKRPDLQLVIRVHPAEIWGKNPSRQKILDELKKIYPVFPKNVYIIPPEARISTYAVMMECNAVIIYGTKTGVELTSVGIPVIVAGESWIRNKKITLDASSVKEYFEILDKLPLRFGMDEETILRARKYAYHFFFRRMIPVKIMRPIANWPLFKMDIASLEDLMPDKYKALDVICDGIVKGSDFIYPAEKFEK